MAAITVVNGSDTSPGYVSACFFATTGTQGIPLPSTTRSSATFTPGGVGGNIGTIPVLASFTLTAPTSVSVQCNQTNTSAMFVPQSTFIVTQVNPQ